MTLPRLDRPSAPEAGARSLAALASLALALASGGRAGAQPPAAPPPAAAAADAERTLRAVFAAGERGDLAALDTLYAGDSLTVIEGAGINRGWRDYRDHHLGPELREMREMRYRPSDIEMHVAGDVAWATFRYGLKATMGPRAVDVVGRGTAVLERRRDGGGWVVRHTQTSGRPRRPTDPPLS